MFHIVEPDTGLRYLLKAALEKRGYSASVFASPNAYLEYFDSEQFTAPIAILSACLMPSMHCFELIEIVRQRLPRQKLLVISSVIPKDKEEELLGLFCYRLRKPFRLDDLFIMLEAFCRCERECRHCNSHRQEEQCRYGLQDHCPFFIASTAPSLPA